MNGYHCFLHLFPYKGVSFKQHQNIHWWVTWLGSTVSDWGGSTVFKPATLWQFSVCLKKPRLMAIQLITQRMFSSTQWALFSEYVHFLKPWCCFSRVDFATCEIKSFVTAHRKFGAQALGWTRIYYATAQGHSASHVAAIQADSRRWALNHWLPPSRAAQSACGYSQAS